jgi:hypothetical protein
MIPLVNKLLDDLDDNVQARTVILIGELANHGECQLKNRCGTADSEYEVEFREAIGGMIPPIIKGLDAESRYVRSGVFGLIIKLANHGEPPLNILAHS